jgi:hypothetical protein
VQCRTTNPLHAIEEKPIAPGSGIQISPGIFRIVDAGCGELEVLAIGEVVSGWLVTLAGVQHDDRQSGFTELLSDHASPCSAPDHDDVG